MTSHCELWPAIPSPIICLSSVYYVLSYVLGTSSRKVCRDLDETQAPALPLGLMKPLPPWVQPWEQNVAWRQWLSKPPGRPERDICHSSTLDFTLAEREGSDVSIHCPVLPCPRCLWREEETETGKFLLKAFKPQTNTIKSHVLMNTISFNLATALWVQSNYPYLTNEKMKTHSGHRANGQQMCDSTEAVWTYILGLAPYTRLPSSGHIFPSSTLGK